MFTVRKALAATAIGALTIVPRAACSSDDASSTTDAATSSASSAMETTESTPEPAAEVDNQAAPDAVPAQLAHDRGRRAARQEP